MFREKQRNPRNAIRNFSLTYQKIDLNFIIGIVILFIFAVKVGFLALVYVFLPAARHGVYCFLRSVCARMCVFPRYGGREEGNLPFTDPYRPIFKNPFTHTAAFTHFFKDNLYLSWNTIVWDLYVDYLFIQICEITYRQYRPVILYMYIHWQPSLIWP